MALTLTAEQEAAVTKLATREIERVKLQAAYDAALAAWQATETAFFAARETVERTAAQQIGQINADYALERSLKQQALDAAKAALDANAKSAGEVVKP